MLFIAKLSKQKETQKRQIGTLCPYKYLTGGLIMTKKAFINRWHIKKLRKNLFALEYILIFAFLKVHEL